VGDKWRENTKIPGVPPWGQKRNDINFSNFITNFTQLDFALYAGPGEKQPRQNPSHRYSPAVKLQRNSGFAPIYFPFLASWFRRLDLYTPEAGSTMLLLPKRRFPPRVHRHQPMYLPLPCTNKPGSYWHQTKSSQLFSPLHEQENKPACIKLEALPPVLAHVASYARELQDRDSHRDKEFPR